MPPIIEGLVTGFAMVAGIVIAYIIIFGYCGG